jgi:serine/threonine protein kinase
MIGVAKVVKQVWSIATRPFAMRRDDQNKDGSQLHAEPDSRPHCTGFGVLDSRYLLIKTLGEGGNGIAFAALDTVTDQLVAVKCSHAEVTSQRVLRVRLFTWDILVASFLHCNVFALHRFCTAASLHCLIVQNKACHQ